MLRIYPPLLAVLATTMLSSPAVAMSVAVSDPVGDFLATYTGPRTADLDFNGAEAFFARDGIFLATSHVAIPGPTPGTSVTWGIDRGSGTPGLFTGDLPIGPDIRFDALLTVRPQGPITLTVFNADAPPTVTELDDRAPFNDTLLVGFVPYDLLPSRGFAFADYRFNAWSRSGSGNAGIADLARETGSFGAVPEPASWAMLIVGFGLTGAVARRRQTAQVTA